MNSRKSAILSSVFGASLTLAVMSIFSKGIGFVREMIYAREFGLNEDYNVFLVAVTIPIIINTSIYFLSQNYFIPAVNRFKSEQEGDENSFFSSSLILFFIVGIIVAALLYLFSGMIIDWYFTTSPESVKDFAQSLFGLYLITIPLTAAASVASAFLQSKNAFHHPALSQLLLNSIVVLLLILFAGEIGVVVIPYAFIAAGIIQLIYLSFFVKKNVRFNAFSDLFDSAKFILGKSLLLTLAAEILSLSFMFVDRYFLNFVNEGGIAALNYAYTIYLLPVSIITMTLSTVLIAKFSESFNKSGKDVFQEKFRTSVSVSVMIFVPIAFVLFLWGDVIVQILFQRGNFSESDSAQTFQVLKIFAVSLVFYSIYGIVNKSLYSVKLLKQLVAITFIALIMKAALNKILVARYFEAGLAASTVIVYAFMFLSAYFVLAYKLKMKGKFEWIKKFAFYIFAGLISVIIIFVFNTTISMSNNALMKVLNIILFLIVYFTLILKVKTTESFFIETSVKELLRGERK